MSEQELEIVENENWEPRVLLIGAVIGAVVGVGAAYLLIKIRRAGRTAPNQRRRRCKIGRFGIGFTAQRCFIG